MGDCGRAVRRRGWMAEARGGRGLSLGRALRLPPIRAAGFLQVCELRPDTQAADLHFHVGFAQGRHDAFRVQGAQEDPLAQLHGGWLAPPISAACVPPALSIFSWMTSTCCSSSFTASRGWRAFFNWALSAPIFSRSTATSSSPSARRGASGCAALVFDLLQALAKLLGLRIEAGARLLQLLALARAAIALLADIVEQLVGCADRRD